MKRWCQQILVQEQRRRRRPLSSSPAAYSPLRSSSCRRHYQRYPIIKQDVKWASAEGQPVVALESTIISHGMPFPKNVEMAMEVEELLRHKGVIPATIAVLRGVPRVGLSVEEIEYLGKGGTTGGIGVMKCTRRDLPSAVGKGLDAATTVAGTMYLAHMAGIRLLVTGGIGGVHRGVELSMDISADLIELGRTPVAVICAGVKSILDISRTLEVLETQGVPVISYGTDDFPAFFSASSGLKSPMRLDRANDIAATIFGARRLNMENGLLIAVPNEGRFATEAFARDMEDGTTLALSQAEAELIRGKDVTPFVLKRLNELTNGASLEANLALIKRNALVGADIAIQLSMLEREPSEKLSGARSFGTSSQEVIEPVPTAAAVATAGGEEGEEKGSSFGGGGGGRGVSSKRDSSIVQGYADDEHRRKEESGGRRRVIVVGAAVVDQVAKASTSTLVLHTSNPGYVLESFGGVGKNIAEMLARTCGAREEGQPAGVVDDKSTVSLISCVGADAFGEQIRDHLQQAGITNANDTIEMIDDCRTSRYVAILDQEGDLLVAVADFEVMERLTPVMLERQVAKVMKGGGANRIKTANGSSVTNDDGNNDEDPSSFLTALTGANAEEMGTRTTNISRSGNGDNVIMVSDGNISTAAFGKLARIVSKEKSILVFEPTSVAKSGLPFEANAMHHVSLITPNMQEALQMVAQIPLNEDFEKGDDKATSGERRHTPPLAVNDVLVSVNGSKVIDYAALKPVLESLLLSMYNGNETTGEIDGKKYVVMTVGSLGVVVASCGRPQCHHDPHMDDMEMFHYWTEPVSMTNCTGAGDALTAGLLCGLMHGYPVPLSVGMGMVLARETLQINATLSSSSSSTSSSSNVGQVKALKEAARQWQPSELADVATREMRPLRIA